MPKYYDYFTAPEYHRTQAEPHTFGTNFVDTFNKMFPYTLASTMEDKRKKRDLDFQLRSSGAIPEDEAMKDESINKLLNDEEIKPYIKRLKILDKTYIIPPDTSEISDIQWKRTKRLLEDENLKLMNAKLKKEINKPIETDTPKESPLIKREKIKATTAYNSIKQSNNLIRSDIERVATALDRVPTGLTGKLKLKELQLKTSVVGANPEEERILSDYQEIDTFLKDQQLAKQLLLKGATSNRDMQVVEQAVGGNWLAVAPQIKVILRKAKDRLEADESAARISYIQNFGEDIEDNKKDNDHMGLFK